MIGEHDAVRQDLSAARPHVEMKFQSRNAPVWRGGLSARIELSLAVDRDISLLLADDQVQSMLAVPNCLHK